VTTRVAVVGLGWSGRELWLPLLRGHRDFEVVAVVDPDPAARAGAVESTGVPAHPTIDALGARSVDLAVVAVPNHLHAEVAASLLGRGISAFVEKPVCLTTAEADVLAAAERDGGMLLAGSAASHRADVRALAGLVPELGDVRHVDLAWVRARGVPKAGGWFTERGKAGGGALVDLGWHLLDALTAILGPARIQRVLGATSDDFIRSDGWSAAWRQDPCAPRTAGDVEDTARGFLVREDGVSVSLRASWASHEARDVSTIRVEGSVGTAQLRCTFGFSPNRQPESDLTVTREGATVRMTVPEEPIGAEYQRQLDGIPAILADPANRGRLIGQARGTVQTIESFYESATAAVRARDRPAAPRLEVRTS
jgi:oxidoreductase